MLDIETDDPIQYNITVNVDRRHLSKSQCAMAAAAYRELYDEPAKERQKVHGGTAPGKQKNTCGKVSTSDSGKSRDKAGKAMNVSGKMVDAATTVLKKGTPALIEAVKSGVVSVTPAARVAGLPAEEQDAAVAKGEKGGQGGQGGKLLQETFPEAKGQSRDKAGLKKGKEKPVPVTLPEREAGDSRDKDLKVANLVIAADGSRHSPRGAVGSIEQQTDSVTRVLPNADQSRGLRCRPGEFSDCGKGLDPVGSPAPEKTAARPVPTTATA